MLDYGSRKTDVVVIHIDNPDQPLYLQLSNNEKSKKQKESLANKGILSLSSFIIKQYDGDIEKILNEHFSEKDNHPESEAKTLEQKQFDTDKKYYLGKASWVLAIILPALKSFVPDSNVATVKWNNIES